jgi:2-polyprenyl-3-methyl-5-hydroxy-6-metoxy-1,4-benzoquinol methylase
LINWLSSQLHRPEKGWDPVPSSHVQTYGDAEWRAGARTETLDLLEKWLGGFAGKSVLDLGGGPGQYTIAFAKRGANVSWHDVSARYRDYTSRRADEAGVKVSFSVGYMDEASSILGRKFDLVFNRICWCYGRGDRSFADTFWDLVAPGGIGYIDTAADRSGYAKSSASAQ